MNKKSVTKLIFLPLIAYIVFLFLIGGILSYLLLVQLQAISSVSLS
ncbi:MAG: hypothetical protein Q4D13_04720 [Erysipelotrichaceae bacterium]|nr:hypothetical protein [Erysipelotrichaceae bacterium]